MCNKKIMALLVTLVLSLGMQLNASADEVRHYSIKQNAPSVGTNMTKEIVKAGTIPLNKSYDELTAAQKDTLKAEYEGLNEADEPPFPVKGLLPIYRAIGNAHERLELQFRGNVNMNVLVDSEGNPKSVEVLDSPDAEITKAATFALMNQKYKPAVCGGQACTMKLPLHAELVGPDVNNLSNFNTPGVSTTHH